MQYLVEIVPDGELPDGVGMVIVERDDDPPVIIFTGAPARCWAACRAWEDTQEPSDLPTVLQMVV